MSTVLEVQAGPGPTGELGREREGPGRCSTLLSPERAKWLHLVTLICVTLLTWALRDYSAPALRETRVIESGCYGTADPDRCAGKEAVLRVSACSAVYFLVLALWTLGVKSEREPRGDASNGYWLLKGLGLAGLLGAAFTVVPNTVFSVYGEIARLGSALFLVFQIVMLLDRIYTWNEWLLEKEYVLPIVIAAVGAYGAAFTLVGYMYHFFGSPGCALNVAFITVSLLLGVAVSVLSVTPFRLPSAGLLTSGIVFVYTLFLCWNAIVSNTDLTEECNPFRGEMQEAAPEWTGVLAFFVALAVVLASIFRLSSKKEAGYSEEDLPYRYDFFHAIFALASMYLSMLFTSWNLNGTDAEEFELNKGKVSMWIKIVSQWVCFSLYAWTMIAPAVCSGREFS